MKNNIFCFISRHQNLNTYLVYGLLAKLVPAFFVVMLGYYMEPDEFGISAVFIAVVTIFSGFFSFGIGVQVVKEYENLEKERYKLLLLTGLVIGVLIWLVCVVVVLLLSDEVLDFFSLSKGWIIFGFCVAYLLFLSEILLKVLMMNKNAKEYGVISFARQAGMAGMAFLLVYLMGGYWENRSIGYVAGLMLLVLFCVPVSFNYIKGIPFRSEYFRSSVMFGVSVMPQMISNWVKMGADKIILSGVMVSAELGKYSYIFFLASLLMIFGAALNNYLTPVIMEKYKKAEFDSVVRLRWKALIVLFFVSISAWILVDEFMRFMPSGYAVSSESAAWLLAGFFCQSVYLIYMKYYIYTDKMMMLGGVNVFSVIVYLYMIFGAGRIDIEYAAMSFFVYSVVLLISSVLLQKKLCN
ncbi:lipopolysaccharide biosynthesis protein [Pontibacter sp. JAM-7]|uniref:lipopolysaccharide biosynthesis protein n=1 Tax=Pontibacter sp. JAM-7 TaxID=3366581 RepID=UPI003AF85389